MRTHDNHVRIGFFRDRVDCCRYFTPDRLTLNLESGRLQPSAQSVNIRLRASQRLFVPSGIDVHHWTVSNRTVHPQRGVAATKRMRRSCLRRMWLLEDHSSEKGQE